MAISPTTGEPFYSGDWDRHIKPLVKALSVDSGKLNTVKASVIERFQEQVDRLIDNKLEALYVVPLAQQRIFNRTKNAFILSYPGKVQEAARYWTAGLLMKAEYQQLDSNVNDAVQNYIDYAVTIVEEIRSMTDRLQGQETRGDLSVFLPSGVMPRVRPEPPSPV